MNITHNHYAGNLCKLKPMDNERNTNIISFLIHSLILVVWQTNLYVPGPSFSKLFLFITVNSFTMNEEPVISLRSQCPLEGQLQHDTLPLRVFTDVFLQNSSSSLSLSSYQLANSKPLSKLRHNVCLNHWSLMQSPTMTSWWTTGRNRYLKSITPQHKVHSGKPTVALLAKNHLSCMEPGSLLPYSQWPNLGP